MQTSPRPLWAALLAALLLVACESPQVPGPGVALQPLATAELRDTLVAHTLARSGGPFWRRWDYAGVHRPDGNMTGRVSWTGGQELATGVWALSPDGLYCRAWGNHWGAGQRGCFRVSRGAETLVFDHVRGSRGDRDRYAYRLLPGNPRGL